MKTELKDSLLLTSKKRISQTFNIRKIFETLLNSGCSEEREFLASGYPYILYHATIDRNSVCTTGLKPSCEVRKKALGQIICEVPTISFTCDLQIGIDIAKDLRTLIAIANNDITNDNIKYELNRRDNEGRIHLGLQHWQYINEKPILDGEYREIEINGKKELFLKLNKHKKYYIPLNKEPSKIWDNIKDRETHLDKDKYYFEDYEQGRLYELWAREYLKERELLGGRHDCWFSVSSNPASMKGLKESDVGLFKVLAFLPYPNITFVPKKSQFKKYLQGLYVVKSEGKWVKNEGELKVNSTNFNIGEFSNLEIKISRERFKDLVEIPIEYPIPKDVIILK